MTSPPRILIAGIGNIFLGDDAFGVHVAQRLSARPLPDDVRLVDFGIRGIDLLYALLDGCETAIFIDAVPRGHPPGTLYLAEPDLSALRSGELGDLLQAHSLNPEAVLRQALAMGSQVQRVLIVGCEPAPFDEATEMSGELSRAVSAAVKPAIDMVESILAKLSFHPPATEASHASFVAVV